jgi:hypothetical protein
MAVTVTIVINHHYIDGPHHARKNVGTGESGRAIAKRGEVSRGIGQIPRVVGVQSKLFRCGQPAA